MNAASNNTPALTWDELERQHQERMRIAMAMGGPQKLARIKEKGLLNARERIDHLVDPESFLEFGLFAQSLRPEDRQRTPADGKISGLARIRGRDVAVVANDFTVMGASSSPINGRKIAHIKDLATRRGLPMVFLGESTGARMPDVMGARAIGAGDRSATYLRKRESPWASAVLGHCYGSSSWYAALADYVVMRKGAVMAVSSAKLTSMAISEKMEPEDLGGWRMHSDVTGMVDAVTDTDEEALDLIKQYLSYLPSHHMEAAPMAPPPAQAPDGRKIHDLVPLERSRVYNMRKVIECLVDPGSLFEMKSRFAKNMITALVRINGRVIGIIANNPMHKGGAIDVLACDKATSFMVMCDSFNIPVMFMVDQPGFLIGIEGERQGAIGQVMNWMNALSLMTVPKVSLIVRKSAGQAVLNMGAGGLSDALLLWPSAEPNFMDPRHAVTIVHGVTPESDPQRYAELLVRMAQDSSPYEMASAYNAQTVIMPHQTRQTVSHLFDALQLRMNGGIGEHLMRCWPTSY